jgi:hypothetical protein
MCQQTQATLPPLAGILMQSKYILHKQRLMTVGPWRIVQDNVEMSALWETRLAEDGTDKWTPRVAIEKNRIVLGKDHIMALPLQLAHYPSFYLSSATSIPVTAIDNRRLHPVTLYLHSSGGSRNFKTGGCSWRQGAWWLLWSPQWVQGFALDGGLGSESPGIWRILTNKGVF